MKSSIAIAAALFLTSLAFIPNAASARGIGSGHIGTVYHGHGSYQGHPGYGARYGYRYGYSYGYGYGRGWCYWHPYACYRFRPLAR